jgi:hypothetical protein
MLLFPIDYCRKQDVSSRQSRQRKNQARKKNVNENLTLLREFLLHEPKYIARFVEFYAICTALLEKCILQM